MKSSIQTVVFPCSINGITAIFQTRPEAWVCITEYKSRFYSYLGSKSIDIIYLSFMLLSSKDELVQSQKLYRL